MKRALLALAMLASVAQAQTSPFVWPDMTADQAQYTQPSTGATVVMIAGKSALIIDNGALLATLTVTLPSAPSDGQRVIIASASGVTALTINGGTIKGTVATLAVNGYVRFIYSASAAAWLRTG